MGGAGGSYSTLGILMKTGLRGAAVPIHRMDQKPPEETVEVTRDAGREERLRFVFLKVWRLMAGFSKGHTSPKVNGDTTSRLFLCDQGCGH